MADHLVFLAGKRTPFGANGRSFKKVSPVDLGVIAGAAALSQARVQPEQVDHVIFGNVLYSVPETIYIPRHIGLRLGVPESVPSLGVNRLCGTGFQVVIEAWHQMLAGDTEVALVGGVENMSQAPYLFREARWGLKMGNAQASDLLSEALYDAYAQAPMAITAENLAEKYGITRQESDAFALRSQEMYAAADRVGSFSDEIVAPTVSVGKKTVQVERDEHPKPETTAEVLGKLKPVFKKEGVVTAGNASGIVDGAAVMVVSTEKKAVKEGWSPLGRMVSYAVVGCDPRIMGIGPACAIPLALERAKLKMDQIDLIEINEAFAPQVLAVERELKSSRELLNVNGGAIAVGHPLAASGTRILMTLLYELRRRKKRYGIGSACIGGGQGIAIVVEAYR